MKPIGPLMREHRLVERMLGLVNIEIDKLSEGFNPDAAFLLTAVDFFHTYADRTHHGKEEDILFRVLADKELSAEHRTMMNTLIEEHKIARRTVGSLANAREAYLAGSKESVAEIKGSLKHLSQLYPAHIEKEDKHFFFPCLEYLTKEEQDAMLEEFAAFDARMIHEKYQALIDNLEGSAPGA